MNSTDQRLTQLFETFKRFSAKMESDVQRLVAAFTTLEQAHNNLLREHRRLAEEVQAMRAQGRETAPVKRVVRVPALKRADQAPAPAPVDAEIIEPE